MSIAYPNSDPPHIRDADWLETFVWVALTAAGVSFVLYQGQEYLEYLIAPTLIVIPAVIVWRMGAFLRKRRHFLQLKNKLKKTIRTYSQAKETTDGLPPGDRELAARQLEAIKKTGWGICKELTNFRAELRDAKQNVLTHLGEVSADELAKKLAPIRVMEVEIDQLLNEFAPIVKSQVPDR